MRRMIQLIENETFTNEAISLDDVVYVNCRFVDCTTVVKSRADACSVIINSVSVGDPGKSGDFVKALDAAKHTPLPFSGEQNFCINGSLAQLEKLGWQTFSECELEKQAMDSVGFLNGPTVKV